MQLTCEGPLPRGKALAIPPMHKPYQAFVPQNSPHVSRFSMCIYTLENPNPQARTEVVWFGSPAWAVAVWGFNHSSRISKDFVKVTEAHPKE